MSTKRQILLGIFIVIVTLTSLAFASDISSLIRDLGDRNKEKAKEASDKLARIGKPAVGHLIVASISNNTHRKRYGARALRGIGQDAADAIPALSKLLKDRDTRTREYAVEALGNMVLQAPQVLPILEKAKKDNNKDVAKKAKLAIERIKAALTDGEKLAEIVKYRLNNVGKKCTSLVLEEESPNQYKGVVEFEDGTKVQVTVEVLGSKVQYSLGDEFKTDVKKADGSLSKPVSQGGEKEGVKISELTTAPSEESYTTIAPESGIYGIPFGATTEDVLKWCTNNNMAILNNTEQEVKEEIKKEVSRIKKLKREFDFEMDSLTSLEKELLGLAEVGTMFEIAKIKAVQEKLEILKNPVVYHMGQKYYLKKIHEGLETYFNGEKVLCTDDRITKTNYMLFFVPTEKSKRMTKNGLGVLVVYLYGDIGQDLRTYATLATFAGNQERSSSANFEIVLTGLLQKYGTPYLASWHLDEYEFIKNVFGPWAISVLVQPDNYVRNDKLVWARSNIFLTANLKKEGEMSNNQHEFEMADNGFFNLLYYDFNATNHIFELHTKVLKDFEKEKQKEKEQALEQVKKDF